MAGEDGTESGSFEALEAELHDVIAEVLGKHGLMVTKWMLGAEGLDNEGSRVLETFTSPDYRAWDSIGILGFLDARERGVVGAAAADEILGVEEDEE